MQGMIAEYERSQIADRTRRGRLHKARKAEFLPWAYRAYGYRYMPKYAGLPPRVEIHPEQAEFPQLVGNVFPDIGHRSIGPHNDLILVEFFFGFGRWI